MKEIVWLQISAGTGPAECGWVVSKVKQVLTAEALANGLDVEVVETLAFDKTYRKQTLFEPDTLLSVLLRLEGNTASSLANDWKGSILWQGNSPFRPKHKRKNWFVGVSRLPELKQSDIDLSNLSKEVTFDAMRSGGAGGQHVNKTNSAVRLTHLPTGLQVRADTDRSQHRNKKIALERLALQLMEQQDLQQQKGLHERWQLHSKVQRGNPARTFVGQEFIENL